MAALIVASAGCSSEEEPALDAIKNTTAQEEVSISDEVDDTDESLTVDDEQTEENSIITEEMNVFVASLEDKAPIYANYLKESCELPVRNGFSYTADLGTGEMTDITMNVYMESYEKVCMETVANGLMGRIVINDGNYYIIDDSSESVTYMSLSEDEAAVMAESMSMSMKPAFNIEDVTIENGVEIIEGIEYISEKVIDSEGNVIINVCADKETSEIKYIISAGITMKITFFDHETNEEVYIIPENYSFTDLNAANEATDVSSSMSE